MSLAGDAASSLLRRGLLWLAALTTLGLAIELGAERHWTQPIQLIAWVATAILAIAILLLTRTPSRGRVRLAQLLVAVVLLSAIFGIWEHIYANYDAGSLDHRYADTWDSLPEATRWWLALSKTVGPSPPLAPAALAQAGLIVILSTVRHPALHPTRAATPIKPS